MLGEHKRYKFTRVVSLAYYPREFTGLSEIKGVQEGWIDAACVEVAAGATQVQVRGKGRGLHGTCVAEHSGWRKLYEHCTNITCSALLCCTSHCEVSFQRLVNYLCWRC